MCRGAAVGSSDSAMAVGRPWRRVRFRSAKAIGRPSCSTGREPEPAPQAYREAVTAFYTGLSAMQTTQEVLARQQRSGLRGGIEALAEGERVSVSWADEEALDFDEGGNG